jgi:cobalt-zinc-cadmium efflux system membrane fusion protein
MMNFLMIAATLALCAVEGCTSREAPAEAQSTHVASEVVLLPSNPKRASIVVDTARAVAERVIATLPAQIVPDEAHTARVATPVAGRIVSLDAQPGDHVRAGQPLAHVRSSDAAQATSDLAKALTTWHTTQATLARSTDLFEHKVVAAREVEQARNDEATAHAEFARAQARAGQLGMRGETVSDTYVLRSPLDGVVLDRTAAPGGEVRPDNGQSLFTISSLGNVWLVVSVPQRDLALVHRGAQLRFTTEAMPGQVFDGRVTFVSDALDPVTRTATARAVLANPGAALHVQTTGSAQVIVRDTAVTTAVPTKALVTRGAETIVFVERAPGHFVPRVVTVRDDDGATATVSAGLQAGERVVTIGSLLLAAELVRSR